LKTPKTTPQTDDGAQKGMMPRAKTKKFRSDWGRKLSLAPANGKAARNPPAVT
jgi:hypothetical protein